MKEELLPYQYKRDWDAKFLTDNETESQGSNTYFTVDYQDFPMNSRDCGNPEYVLWKYGIVHWNIQIKMLTL